MTSVVDLEQDVGPGWRPLLAELHRELAGNGFEYEALQVKEKWGILRVYISIAGESHVAVDMTALGIGTVHLDTVDNADEVTSRWLAAMDIVHAYEVKSAVICENCGQPGILRTSRFWLRTLCDACEEGR